MLDTQVIQAQDQEWQPLQLRLHEALMAAARREPDRVGWVFGDERVTVSSMEEGAKRLALVFAQEGIGYGDTVVVWLPNEVTWAYALYACSMLGARLASINTRSKADEAAHVIRDSGAKLLLFRPFFLNIDYLEILREVSPALAALPHMNPESAAGARPHLLSLGGGAVSNVPRLLESLYPLVAGAELPPVPDRPAPDREAVLIQYTSGSTKMPKGALLHHVHVLNFGYPVSVRLGVGPGDSMLNTQPFYHIGGSCSSLSVPLLLDCIMVIPEYYDAELVLRLIERERCVARTGMATMYLREMQLPNFRDFDLTSLRNGWSIAPPAVLDRLRADYPIEIIQLYGSSEGGGTCGTFSDPWEVRRVSSGSPFPGTEFSIVDPETETDLPVGQTGEIRFRGWALCLGYVSGASHEETFDQRGRFRSGDLGHFDAQGELYFDGRIKDIIKPGGENVSALEVETFLLEHPAVHQVAVVGVPDDDLGEAVMAIIELAAGHSLSQEALAAHCRGKIANFRIPRHLRIVTEWPMTGSGKILKRVLQVQYAKELEAARSP